MNDATSMNGYDVQALRRDFPILSRKVHGRPLVYLDNAASAQKPKAVIDAMTEFLTTEYANVHRGVHYLSGAATERYEEARRRIQRDVHERVQTSAFVAVPSAWRTTKGWRFGW